MIRSTNILSILKNLRSRALKKKIWHKALDKHERLLTSLISKHIKIVKNPTLATVIAKIIGKIINALKGISKQIFILGFETSKSWSVSAKASGWDISNWLDVDVIRWFGLFKLSNIFAR
ncbi:MAG: hypothetical protein KatS3mg003_0669 [Candidatus Nitrosocaldaceae archaeon]|nr:MAG: hypothetical protein KatS3mg003_0652 [Candidatus Nitrosocaldaceae archaeon]GIU71190.1 MAG: hypothetical protein KatS3mg003_0669 [Candidatus Nitrosocaldaceae archaeon]